MLKKRLIPKLQMKSRMVGSKRRMILVNTIRFQDVIEIGDPVSQAKIFESQAADELIFLDLDASQENRGTVLEVVRKAAEEIFMPFTVGGGVKSLEDIRLLLGNGADKVSINTAAVQDPKLIADGARVFGSQCIVVSIDYKKTDEGQFRVFTRGGREATAWEPLAWALEAEKRGAGEILLTSIDHDGTQNGLELDILRQVAERVKVPVIASGGCGLARHFIDGFQLGKADAVAAGTFFSFRDQNPIQARAHIRNAGIPIRLHQ